MNPINAALINKTTMVVEQVIVADPAVDPYPVPYTPDKYLFVVVTGTEWKDAYVVPGTKYDGVNYIHPAAPVKVKGVPTL